MFVKVAQRALEEAGIPASEERLLAEIDIDALRLAFAEPFGFIDGSPLYPEPAAQAAILASRIIRSVDLPSGFELSTALLFVDLRLQGAGLELEAPASEIESVFIAIAEQRVSDDALITWFTRRTRPMRMPS